MGWCRPAAEAGSEPCSTAAPRRTTEDQPGDQGSVCVCVCVCVRDKRVNYS